MFGLAPWEEAVLTHVKVETPQTAIPATGTKVKVSSNVKVTSVNVTVTWYVLLYGVHNILQPICYIWHLMSRCSFSPFQRLYTLSLSWKSINDCIMFLHKKHTLNHLVIQISIIIFVLISNIKVIVINIVISNKYVINKKQKKKKIKNKYTVTKLWPCCTCTWDRWWGWFCRYCTWPGVGRSRRRPVGAWRAPRRGTGAPGVTSPGTVLPWSPPYRPPTNIYHGSMLKF